MLKFINRGKDVQVRQSDGQGYKWKLLKTGETIDLPEEVGRKYGFRKLVDVTPYAKDMLTGKGPSHQKLPKVTEGKIGNKKVETKQIETDKLTDKKTDEFLKELIKIQGIGPKTAKDIVSWGTKEKLIEVIEAGGSMPFRDDIENKLRKKYG